MSKTKKQIIDDITDFFKGLRYHTCYIGITSDIGRRLFSDHNVPKESGGWIYRTASSNAIAREIEQYFINAGMDGGPSGGDSTSTIVYAYMKDTYSDP